MIRQLTESDLEAVMRIWLNGNLQAHSFTAPDYWISNYNNVKALLPRANVYIYEHDGEVCGFIGLDGTFIQGLFVDSAYRSQGIGKILLDYVKSSNSTLQLTVYERNKRAVSFYKREGFRQISSQIDKNTDESELITSSHMSRRL